MLVSLFVTKERAIGTGNPSVLIFFYDKIYKYGDQCILTYT